MLSFDRVTKRFGDHVAVIDVSLEVGAGEFVFLTGPSGSGKTTLLRLANRELVADGGRVSVDGVDVAGLGGRGVAALRRRVAVVPQDHRLLATHDVGDNIAFALRIAGWRPDAVRRRVGEVLDLVGLAGTAERMPSQLSGGERQRIAIARAVAAYPDMLVADEPTGNLDPVTSVGIVRLLSAINADGVTVVMSTHDRAVVDAMRARVVTMRDGTIALDDNDAGYVTDAEVAR